MSNGEGRLCMIPEFNSEGNLPEGIYYVLWDEFASHFGTNAHRRRLLRGLYMALKNLKQAGCETIYIDGSFVTSKEIPGDFDACWDTANVNPSMLDKVLLMFKDGQAAQKAKYFGELFPNGIEGATGKTFLEFFQVDKYSGNPKGIIAIDLGGLV